MEKPDRGEQARERAAQARRRQGEIAGRLAGMRQGDGATMGTVEQASEAARRSAELAVEGYDHAADGMLRAAEAHERVADGLELHSEDAGEGRTELLRRARQHREDAVRDREEAATDRDAAEKLRRHL